MSASEAEPIEAIAEHLRQASDQPGFYDFSMVGYPLQNTLSAHGHVARGVCQVAADGTLISIQEHTRIQAFSDGIKTWHEASDWTPLAGDRNFADDHAIMGGLARFLSLIHI